MGQKKHVSRQQAMLLMTELSHQVRNNGKFRWAAAPPLILKPCLFGLDEDDWPDAQASCQRDWPCPAVWKSLWGNTITGSNPAHLPRPCLTASLRSGQQHPAESLPWWTAGTNPLSAASSVPMSKPTDYFTCFVGCIAECRARSWQAEAHTVISAWCGRLRPYAAVAEGRAQLTTDLHDSFYAGPTPSPRIYGEVHKQIHGDASG